MNARRLWILAGLVGFSFITALYLSLAPRDESAVASQGADSFSRSAVGHHALFALLSRVGIEVSRSRFLPAERLRPGDLLLLLEPEVYEPDELRALLETAHAKDAAALLVLPKWSWIPSTSNPDQIERAALYAPSWPEELLRDATEDEEARVERPERVERWAGLSPGEVAPDLLAPQLVRAPGLAPLLSAPEGKLLSQLGAKEIFILSDPDLLNNHGLARGENAALVLRLLQRLGRRVVIDETTHGYTLPPSLWRELTSPPLVYASLHVALCSLLLVWVALVRLGNPSPLLPALRSGKQALLDNAAELLALGGHHAHALRAYRRAVLRQAAAACSLPASLSDDEREARLGLLATARGAADDIAALGREIEALPPKASARRCLALASALHRWRVAVEAAPPDRKDRGERRTAWN